MKTSLAAAVLTAACILRVFGQEIVSSKPLELEEALRLAVERNPQLRAAQFGVQAAEGQVAQAGAIPNPTLSFEVEDFGGNGERRGFDGSEMTVALEQTIGLGGKRAARQKAAASEARLAEWDRDALRLDVTRETTDRFVDALAAQVEATLSQEALQMAETIHQAASNRVKAGKDSPVEEAKARAELALARLAVQRAQSQLTVSRQTLSAMWAEPAPTFTTVSENRAGIAPALPPLAHLQEAMTRSPEWARWTDDIRAAESVAEAERRSWIPDFSIGAGIRQSQADDTQAYVAGVSMELPLFDRRRGSLAAARAELERKRAGQEAARAALRNELATAYELLSSIQKAAATIARDALPAAEQAFAAAQASYASGKLGYLDIQDARRLLIEMRRQHTETLTGYRHAVARIERLTGTPLNTPRQTTDRGEPQR